MPTAIFVHGTGVREPAFSRLFQHIQKEMRDRRPEFEVVPCYWGEAEGARLWHDGASIPSYNTARAIAPTPEDEYLALWSLLYQDPFWELRTLAVAGAVGRRETPPGTLPPGDLLHARVQNLELTLDRATTLPSAGLTKTFESAKAAVVTAEPYQRALVSTTAGVGTLRLAIARAIVAKALTEQAEADGDINPNVTDADSRDQVVQMLVDALGGRDRGLADLVGTPIRGLALRVATAKARRRRGALTDAAYPAAGDILLYQVRGNRIRESIAKHVAAATEPVVLLTHSLGGIAAVDLLASQPLPTVRLLVTVGSQAPFLYEIGALWSVAPNDPLPDQVPAWLNIYDPRDILSYVGAPIFGRARVEDIEVDSRQPFPQSHSAYWANRNVWDAIAARLP